MGRPRPDATGAWPEHSDTVTPENERRAPERTSAMPFAEWSDEFSVGVEEIDREHKRLLALLNDLHDAVQAGSAHEVLGKVMDELLLYVSYHFAHEEELFLRTNYPGFERHRLQHRALTITVKEIYEDFQQSDSEALPSQVLQFLKNWLCEHIMGSDRAFGVYYNACLVQPGPQAPPVEEASAPQ
jgi:hemerythrin